MPNYNLREEFLTHFIKTLIEHIHPRAENQRMTFQLPTEQEKYEAPQSKIMLHTLEAKEESLPPLPPQNSQMQTSQSAVVATPQEMQPIVPQAALPSLPPLPLLPSPSPMREIKNQIEAQSQKNQASPPALNSLLALFRDPLVQMVECPGPGKQVVLTKAGMIYTTPLVLTEPMINESVAYIAQETKVPLIPGFFKAAWNNFLVTAVRSEFIGTRFVIQRKNVAAFAPPPLMPH